MNYNILLHLRGAQLITTLINASHPETRMGKLIDSHVLYIGYIYILYIAQEGASLISEFYKYKWAPAIPFLNIYDTTFHIINNCVQIEIDIISLL